MKKVGLTQIFGSVAVMLGPTGGKGVIISTLKTTLEDHGIKLMTLSSGDCFRRAQNRNPELKARMSAGKLIEDLDDIRDEIKGKIKEFIVDLLDGKKVSFFEDGEERLGGEYVYQEKEGKVGEKAVSQVMQMTDMYWEVLEDLVNDPEYSERLGSDVHALFDGDKDELVFIDEGIPYEYRDIYETVEYEGLKGPLACEVSRRDILSFWYKSADRFLVNTSLEDSEAFMRVRSCEAIQKLIDKNVWIKGTTVSDYVDYLLALQQGRFELFYTKHETTRKQMIVVKPDAEARTLKPLTGVSTQAFDNEMDLVARRINLLAGNFEEGNQLQRLQDSLKILIDERALVSDNKEELYGLVEGIRIDDLSLASRRERAKVYRQETIKMMKDELGYVRLSEEESSERIGRKVKRGEEVWVRQDGPGAEFINGPSFGVSLEGIRKQARVVGNELGVAINSQYNSLEGVRRGSLERSAA